MTTTTPATTNGTGTSTLINCPRIDQEAVFSLECSMSSFATNS